jgi:hypothetical protein
MPVKNHEIILKLAAICNPIMRPSAAETWPEDYQHEFHIESATGAVLHNGDNMPADKFIAALRETRPYYFPDTVADNLQRDALAGNMTARGALYKQLGEKQFGEWLKANGLASMTAKYTAPDKPNGAAKSKSTNPWGADSWDFARQLSITKALGAVKAAEMAAAAGSFLGATRPGAKQLTPRGTT